MNGVLGGTKGFTNEELKANLIKRFKEMGESVGIAFIKGLRGNIDELLKAGTIVTSDSADLLKADTNKKMSDVFEGVRTSFKDFNKLFANDQPLILEMDDKIVIDYDLVDAVRTSLQGQDAELAKFNEGFTNLEKVVNEQNRYLEAITINHNTEMLNIYVDFADKFIKSFQDRNRYEIREQSLTINQLDRDFVKHNEKTLELLKDEAKKREKNGKKITKDEIAQNKLRMTIVLGMLKDRQNEEMNLERKKNDDAFAEMQKQTDAILKNGDALTEEQKKIKLKSIQLVREELKLKMLLLEDKQSKEYNAIKEQYEKISGITKEGEPDPND